MFFLRPKAARWLIDSGRTIVPSYRKAAEEAGSGNPDRDAAIMFCGFIHFALNVYVAYGKIRETDIVPVLAACSLHIRQYAPNFSLPVSYLDDTRVSVQHALEASKGDPFLWTREYYKEIRSQIEVDEGRFCGALSADSLHIISN